MGGGSGGEAGARAVEGGGGAGGTRGGRGREGGGGRRWKITKGEGQFFAEAPNRILAEGQPGSSDRGWGSG